MEMTVSKAIAEAAKAIERSAIKKYEDASKGVFRKKVLIKISPVQDRVEVPQILASSYYCSVNYTLTIEVLDKADKERFF